LLLVRKGPASNLPLHDTQTHPWRRPSSRRGLRRDKRAVQCRCRGALAPLPRSPLLPWWPRGRRGVRRGARAGSRVKQGERRSKAAMAKGRVFIHVHA